MKKDTWEIVRDRDGMCRKDEVVCWLKKTEGRRGLFTRLVKNTKSHTCWSQVEKFLDLQIIHQIYFVSFHFEKTSLLKSDELEKLVLGPRRFFIL